jgi:ABC-type Fe3+/spermidine/putrescine transport system ATPase subunit
MTRPRTTFIVSPMTAKGETTDGIGASVLLNHVDKSFGVTPAIDDLSLAIKPSEFMTLLGPSGSGKTTTLMMIAGFEIPTGGEIYIDSRPILGVPPHRRNIGMVFQNYALFPHMTVAENIGFPLKQRGVDKPAIAAGIKAVLDTVQLSGHEARYPRQLSGGQQQRVALARAIVFQPRVLLMDEPLSALDKQLREELQHEVKRLHKQLGITFIYVTHDQREALVMSDRIAVVNHGRLEQVGGPAELYDRPPTDSLRRFSESPTSSTRRQSVSRPIRSWRTSAAGGCGRWATGRSRWARHSSWRCVQRNSCSLGTTRLYPMRMSIALQQSSAR